MECKQEMVTLNIETYNDLIKKSVMYDLFKEQFINITKNCSSINYREMLSFNNDEINYIIGNLIPKEYNEQLEKLKK